MMAPSREVTPWSAAQVARLRDWWGVVVDRLMSVRPARPPATGSRTSWTDVRSNRHATITVASATAAPTVSATVAPPGALPGVRFQTTVSASCFRFADASARPISPSPRNVVIGPSLSLRFVDHGSRGTFGRASTYFFVQYLPFRKSWPGAATMTSVRRGPYICGIDAAMDVVSGKWKSLILWELDNYGARRFGELRRGLRGVSEKMLIQQLREMEQDGLIHREVHREVPPRVEYSLTESGRSLNE